MQNTTDFSQILPCSKTSILPGIIARDEEKKASEEAKAIYNAKHTKRSKYLKQNADAYTTKIAQNCYKYYLSLIRQKMLHTLTGFLVLTLFIAGIGLIAWNLNNIYNRYYNLEATDDTLNAAIKYNQNGDYDAAISRLKTLINQGWDGYRVYQEITSAYYAKLDYNSAANLLCNYIEKYYGAVNCTMTTDSYYLLLV